MLKNKQLTKGYKMNKANKLFNEIGNNTLNNEKTSIGIIEHYTNLNIENKLKVNSYSLYTILGVKNNAGIVSYLRGQDTLIKLQGIRKSFVDRVILPIADLKHLVEKTEDKTKVEKNKDKAEKKQLVESDKVANKSDEKVKNNAIRTTANNITYPTLFLCSQDKSNYKFKDNRVMINVMALSDEIVKSVFGFKKEKIQVENGSKFFIECNFSLLQKLSQKVLFNVKVTRGIEEEAEADNLEEATDNATSSEYSEDKANNMVKSIVAQINYLENNEGFDQILQIENHIRSLEEYNFKLEDLTDPVQKQNKTSINLIGSVAVPSGSCVELQGNTIELLQDSLYKKYKVKVA